MMVAVEDVARFAALVEARLGIRVADRETAMAELVARRSASHRESPGAYLRRLEDSDHEELRTLASEVSVGETYFFRHAEQCRAYADLIPVIHRERGHVRVLSAGCSSGEEPYTLAMLARENVIDPRGVVVHGIDFNPVALARAAKAVYTRWAMRATSPDLERRWFTRSGRDLELVAEIKRAVTFAEVNLLEDAAWTRETWDIVFCRNVIMYFNDARGREVIDRLVRALAPGGYLFLGHAETLRELPPGVELCHTHGTFYYRRAGAPGTTTMAPLASAWADDIAAAAQRVHALVDGALTKPLKPDVAVSLEPIRAMIIAERFADALAALAKLPVHDADAQLLAAVVQTQTGDIATAETSCRKLLAANPNHASAHYLWSICTTDPIAAMQHAREAQTLDPSFAMAAIQLAFLARRAGDRGGAAEQLGRAIALLDREDPARLALFAGGFSQAGLVQMCRAELARSSH